MLGLRTVVLLETTEQNLHRYQREIDELTEYPVRVDAAKRRFSLYNRSTNRTFQDVRQKLAQMCGGTIRCAYCEDSAADEVEHVHPKDLYPDHVFRWINYVYACGPCNSRKSNRFTVIDSAGMLIDVSRKRFDPVLPPSAGTPALINPRTENPLHFLEMDLTGTFYVLPGLELNDIDKIRAEETIRLLDLNRELLCVARRNAYEGYRARLSEYVVLANSGAQDDAKRALQDSLLATPHPTVWEEMKRQSHLIDELKVLFEQAEEALTWAR